MKPLTFFKNTRGQAPISEYAFIFVIALAMILAMTVYVRRTLQSRLRDANQYMAREVRDKAGEGLVGSIMLEYEPYYLKSDSEIAQSSNTEKVLGSAFGTTSGRFNKTINEYLAVNTVTETKPPKDAQ